MADLHWNAELMLRRYIYDYMVRKNLRASAQIFQNEARVPISPAAISDSPCGFLLEWWMVFWDTYIANQSNLEVQQAPNEVSLQQNYQGYYSSQFLENGSTGKEPWLATQLQQPAAMISQRAASFNLAENIFLQNHSVQHNQQIKSAYQSTNLFTGLDENCVKQSNFFRAAKQDLQSVNNLAFHLNIGMNNAAIQNAQQRNFGDTRLNGSLPLDLINVAPAKLKMPAFAFPHTAKGVHLGPDNNKLRAGPSSGIGSTSMKMEHRGLNQWLMPSEEWQELLRLTSQQQLPVQGFNAPSFGSPLRPQTVNISDPSNMYFQIDTPKIAEAAQTECIRKRKEPSYSGSEKSLGNKKVAGPSKLPCRTLASPLKDNAAFQIFTKNCGEVGQPEITTKLDISEHLKEDSATEDAECQPPSTEDANEKGLLKNAGAEDQEEIDPKILQQYLLDDNEDDKNDQNKLGGGTLTAMEDPVEKHNSMNQQLKQDVSLNDSVQPEISDRSAKEAGDENGSTTNPSTRLPWMGAERK